MENPLIFFLVGLGLMALGYLFLKKEKFVEWSLSFGSGENLVERLGLETAKRMTRYFFGPLLLIVGVIMFLFALRTLFQL